MSLMDDFKHLKISLKCIQAATNNFRDKPIGSGGFGIVYKGELVLQKGPRMVAFKRLDRKFGQGDVEFWKEIILLSELKHKNLATLLHFCNEDEERILVYELDDIILPGLKEQINHESLSTFAAIANRCLNRDHKERPHIVEIVKELEAAILQQNSFQRKPGVAKMTVSYNAIYDRHVIDVGGFGKANSGEPLLPEGQNREELLLPEGQNRGELLLPEVRRIITAFLFNLTTTNDDTTRLTTNLNITLSTKNPNKKVVYYYDPFAITCLVSDDTVIANGTFNVPLETGPNNITIIRSALNSNAQLLEMSTVNLVRSDLKKKSGLKLKVLLDTEARVKVESFRSKKVGIRIQCEGVHSAIPKVVNGTATAVAATVTDAKCNVDLRIKIWKWSFTS
ncbi:Late embryogenesis abundant protein, LEA-14 [Artemisia annua]|uniref:Late embryogenesis abundant protein, LEA-14 n=1 Tax=Artemisia annua TaxID=35608 RepID=A0A2U1LLW9_ARTAN|nr:Late embryogenesis abundant protein, LEA-14 [Artemisia annua]